MGGEGSPDEPAPRVGGAGRRMLVPLAGLVLVGGAVCVGLQPDVPSPTPAPATSYSVGAKGSVTIYDLGLTFRLPSPLGAFDHPDLDFLARNGDRTLIFSIARAEPGVLEHEPEHDESVAAADIEGVDAVVVTNAYMEDLPEGAVARQLLVANGDRSFTVILSGREDVVSRVWEEFMSSIEVEPA